MATAQISARLLVGGAFAIAITIAPAVGVFSGPAIPAPSRIVADPGPNCTANQTHGSYSLACAPNPGGLAPAANNGLPSEMGLTAQNSTRGR